MKYLSSRELRNTPGVIKDQVRDEDLVLTANGRPVALVIGVDDGDIEETLALVRQARAMRAVSRLRQQAAESGSSQLTEADIDLEIAAARRGRRKG